MRETGTNTPLFLPSFRVGLSQFRFDGSSPKESKDKSNNLFLYSHYNEREKNFPICFLTAFTRIKTLSAYSPEIGVKIRIYNNNNITLCSKNEGSIEQAVLPSCIKNKTYKTRKLLRIALFSSKRLQILSCISYITYHIKIQKIEYQYMGISCTITSKTKRQNRWMLLCIYFAHYLAAFPYNLL